MTISAFTFVSTQTAAFSKANSGYANTTAGPTQNSFSLAANSGNCFLKQVLVGTGATTTIDFASGGATDLVGDTVNFARIFSLEILPGSGAIQVQTSQSGGMLIPQFGLSGGGFLINAGFCWSTGGGFSGLQLPVTATAGNLVFKAVSGNCLLSVGVYGV